MSSTGPTGPTDSDDTGDTGRDDTDRDDLVPPDPQQAAAATQLARELLLAGVPDEQVTLRLGRSADVPSLRRAAQQAAGFRGYPGTRIHRCLEAAATGSVPEPLDPARAASDEGERRLLTAPAAAAWALLTEQVPALAELARQAELPSGLPEPGRLARLRPGGGRRASLRTVLGRGRHLVGPDSDQTDPLLASPAAAFVASRHLVAALERAEAARRDERASSRQK